MKHSYVLLILLFAFSFTQAQTIENANDSTASVSAINWLKLVDDGMYSKSWEEGAELFRNSLSKEQWDNALNNVRKPLGEKVKRELKSKKYSKELPGMPDGDYYSFEFDTSFENKKVSVETLSLMKDNNDWKVIGYFIR